MKARQIAARFVVSALAAAMTACIAVPTDVPQQAPVEQSRLGLAPAPEAAVPDGWWNVYGDPQLDRLMRQALAGNPTLAQALARVREAQILVDEAKAGTEPNVSYDASESRERFSKNDIIPPPYGGHVYWEGNEGLNFSWDLDFWGKQASLLKQARADVHAKALDAAGARLLISAAVLQAYVQLDRNYALGDIAQKSADQRQKILELTRDRVHAGLDTRVELREAEGPVPQAQVELSQAQAAVAQAVHQLAALSGQGAAAYGSIERPHVNELATAALPKSLPADLLGRRPDILAAEARIEAATAGKAAAKAGFYPDINLTALAGSSAIGFTSLFEASSVTYGAGPALHLPLFDAGRLKAEYRGANAQIDDAVAAYNETVLQAVRQVSDQLTLVDAIAGQLADQQKTVDAAAEAYRLAQERYQHGLSNQLPMLNAQTAVLNARRQQVELIAAQATARVALLLALGGSFDANAPLPL
jgi:NodT family efflux transporter outer membrane factor (OMF) lipoprotein